MSIPTVQLTFSPEVAFTLNFNSGSYLASSLDLMGLFISSSACTYSVNPGDKDFTLFLSNTFLVFPITQLPKLKQFLAEVQTLSAAKDAA